MKSLTEPGSRRSPAWVEAGPSGRAGSSEPSMWRQPPHAGSQSSLKSKTWLASLRGISTCGPRCAAGARKGAHLELRDRRAAGRARPRRRRGRPPTSVRPQGPATPVTAIPAQTARLPASGTRQRQAEAHVLLAVVMAEAPETGGRGMPRAVPRPLQAPTRSQGSPSGGTAGPSRTRLRASRSSAVTPTCSNFPAVRRRGRRGAFWPGSR